MRAIPSIDIEDPHRAKLRNDIDEPISVKSSIDNEEPNLPMPKMDKDEPIRAKDRTDMEDPTNVKSNMEMENPIRPRPKMEVAKSEQP